MDKDEYKDEKAEKSGNQKRKSLALRNNIFITFFSSYNFFITLDNSSKDI